MPQPELHASLTAIRREAELARDAGSLRAVAREAGTSPMGLHNFLLGKGKLQARTVRKLNLWYARRMATRPPGGEDEARAALAILAGFFPESERHRVLRNSLDNLEQEFRESGMPAPAWLDRLRSELLPSG
ncbi:MAG TPA: hypothetical protein VFR37_14520 [Longimicrobium sp.]|nr:hypothetical protein [Longimicrobium sp.]